MYGQTPPSPRTELAMEQPVLQVLVSDIYDRFARLLAHAHFEFDRVPSDELASFSLVLGEPATLHLNKPSEVWSIPSFRDRLTTGDAVASIETLRKAALRPVAPAQPPCLAARRADGGWKAEFDFSAARLRAGELTALASEYIETALRSSERGDMCDFIVDAARAAEALAKADLLSYPVASADVEIFRDPASLLSAYQLWARFRATDPRYPALLQLLFSLRGPFELERSEIATREWARTQLQTLLAQYQHTHRLVNSTEMQTVDIIALGAGHAECPMAFINAPVCLWDMTSGVGQFA